MSARRAPAKLQEIYAGGTDKHTSATNPDRKINNLGFTHPPHTPGQGHGTKKENE